MQMINGGCMKRNVWKYGLLLLYYSIFLCACNRQEEEMIPGNISEPEIEEDVISGISKLLCGEDGVLYGIDSTGTRIVRYNAENECAEETLVEAEGIQTFCYENGRIYYITINKLYELDIESKKRKELVTFDGEVYWFDKMVMIGDSVFVIRKGLYDDSQSRTRYDNTDEYQYEGEVLVEFVLTSGRLKTIPVTNIKCIAKKSEDELLIYAYDSEGGFYFTSYCVAEKTFSEKQYRDNNIRSVADIAYDSSLQIVFMVNYQGIFAMPADSRFGVLQVYDGGEKLLGSLQCEDGVTYALERSMTEKVIRLANASLNLDVPMLKAYTLSQFSNTATNGFQIQFEEITADELTLRILAGDTDYDFLLVNSQWDLGYHISRIGAYVELNDIAGVEEYLGECHAFAGEAASMEDGTIWMLPYNVEGTVLCYNEKLFQEMGLTMADIDTVEEVYALAEKVIFEDSAYVDIPVALLASNMLNKYIANYGIEKGYANYDTELFRKIAGIRKQYEMKSYNGTLSYNTFHPAFPMGKYTEEQVRAVFEKTLLSIVRTEDLQTDTRTMLKQEFLHAAPMPDLEDGVNLKDEVNITFLVINPKSEKLPWVKKYVESLCKKLRADTESLLIKNNTFPETPMLEEIMDILSDARVTFLYPESIVSDAMYSYLFEGQSLDESVEEIERVMNMYMHE